MLMSMVVHMQLESDMWQFPKTDPPAFTCRTKRWSASADNSTAHENNQAQAWTGWSAADSQESSCEIAVLQGRIPSEVQPSN